MLSRSGGSLLLQDLEPGDVRRADVEQIEAAGKRAVDLTWQLLAFGRKQILQPRLVNLSDVIARVEKMLRRLIGEDVELDLLFASDLGSVEVDPGQIEQIVMNLAVNSRDAMHSGGKLTIETANVYLDADYASEHLGVEAGPHVALTVSDNGTGMDEATQARIFEPFFTTKPKGKGTGLGLATAFGIVQQSRGHIVVDSALGKGTRFTIYFPRTDRDAALAPTEPLPLPPAFARGTETILLVEDDPAVRTVVRSILRRTGYHVLEADSVGDAIVICEKHADVIDLMLTDMVMPRMSGRELADRLTRIRPAMKVIFMSGYTDDSIVHRGVLDGDVAFIQKPVTPESLTRKVRVVLESPCRSPVDM